jgi:hypothetical protein
MSGASIEGRPVNRADVMAPNCYAVKYLTISGTRNIACGTTVTWLSAAVLARYLN